MEDLGGRVVCGCVLREFIGRGGFGAVYRASQLVPEREVAVKIILPQFAQAPEFVRRFDVEARLIAMLEHPFIVPLYDYCQEPDGSAYIVMRWLRGGSLRQRLGSGPLGLADVVSMLDQIAHALAVAHQKGVVHRDVKPDNILFDEYGNAHLGDFGIAKDLSSDVHLTSTGHQLGTPVYAAPEQVAGQAVTPQTDLYSLALMMYECLVDTPIFLKVWQHGFPRHLPPLAGYRPDLPVSLDLVLRRATANDPAGRFPDTLTLADEFRRAAESSPPAKLAETPPMPDDLQRTSGSSAQSIPPPSTIRLISSKQPIEERLPTMDSATPVPGDRSAILVVTADDVPFRPRRLLGRSGLRAQIHQVLDQNERVLLQGTAGMGKTALASEVVVDRILQDKGPVLWLRTGNDGGKAVFEALLRPFDAGPMIAGMQEDQMIPMVRKTLVNERIRLLVLDDVWNPEALQVVCEALPPTIPLLVTSRQRYPGSTILDVGELELEEALALLNYYAHRSYTASDSAAVALCNRLGRHAFALEIAGETLQVDILTPTDFLKRIADTPHLIEIPGGFGKKGRRSVKELLDASVRTLDETAQGVLLAFGALFVAASTPQLIALCLGLDITVVERSLITLSRRGLAKQTLELRGSVARFQVHDLVFSYAKAGLHPGLPAVVTACREYAIQNKDNLDALDAERTNLLKAAESAHEIGQHEVLVAIMRALVVDGPYFKARGHDSLLLRQLDRAIDFCRQGGEARLETLHYFLGKRGDAWKAQGDLDQALDCYQESHQLAHRLNLREREALLMCIIGSVHADREQFAAAEDVIAQAYDLANQLGNEVLVARVLQLRGYCAQAQHDFEAARRWFAEEVQVAQRSNNVHEMFYATLNLGAAEHDLAHFPAALSIFQENLRLAEQENNRVWRGHALFSSGMSYCEMGGHEEQARAALEEALNIFTESGLQAQVAEVEAYLRKARFRS